MKHIFIFASLSIFGFSIINPQYASYIYIIWAASFVLMYLGWSLFYGIIMLVTMASREDSFVSIRARHMVKDEMTNSEIKKAEALTEVYFSQFVTPFNQKP